MIFQNCLKFHSPNGSWNYVKQFRNITNGIYVKHYYKSCCYLYKKHKTIQVNVKFTEIIIYHLPISYQRKTVQKRNNNTENVSGNNTKTITQNLQHQQGNLDACRICTTKWNVKSVFKGRTMIVFKSYFSLNAQISRKSTRTFSKEIFSSCRQLQAVYSEFYN